MRNIKIRRAAVQSGSAPVGNRRQERSAKMEGEGMEDVLAPGQGVIEIYYVLTTLWGRAVFMGEGLLVRYGGWRHFIGVGKE